MSIFSEYPYLNYSDMNLDFVIKHMKEVLEEVDALDKWKANHEIEYRELKQIYDNVVAGKFPDSMKKAWLKWMHENAPDVIAEIMKNVFFGLTDSGHFVVYIPESWSDIKFNTTNYDIITELMPEFGHLVLSY